MEPQTEPLLAAPRSRFWWTILILIAPIFWGIALFFSRIDARDFIDMMREDGPIENFEAIVLVAAIFFSAAITWKMFRAQRRGWATIYFCLTIFLIFVTGEEISWGQRIFGLATPEWFEHNNKQDEITVHNLKQLRSVMWVVRMIVPGLLVLVCACSLQIARRVPEKWLPFLWLPHPVLVPTWLCDFSYSMLRVAFYILHPGAQHVSRLVSRVQEPSELTVYFGVFAFLLLVWLRLRRHGIDSLGEL